MVRDNPVVKGMKYIIASIEEVTKGKFETKTLKVATIAN